MTTYLTFPNDKGELNTSYRATLGGSEFILKLRYNERLARYFAELYDTDGALLRGSVKVVTDQPMWLDARHDPAMPTSIIMPQTLSPNTSPPTLLELGEGERVELTVIDV